MQNTAMRILTIILLIFVIKGANAQEYFQQEVNYTISGSLDDSLHIFDGQITMEYINNSPDTLDFIFMHLWANAFKDRTSAFNRQKIRQGETGTYFAKEKFRGNYTNLKFSVDGIGAELKFVKDNPDIAKIILPQKLLPGKKINMASPFTLKIPGSFSRLGHVGQTYQMTQWYPKPAVYDRDGWHEMPYLDMGEYYSEFGRFDVSITLPENYVVGATGTLETNSEIEFLKDKVAQTKQKLQSELSGNLDIPVSSEKMKTIRYTAENVHDFAWFADKRFMVQKSEVKLSSGKIIDTWTMFTEQEGELWKKSIDYVDRSVKYYSDMVGDYPYPQASAVQSALSAGGGMEYPMITVIGLSGSAKPLDAVITHEVGHNWFYGILAFNERDYPWLDEGINSYYDHRYLTKYYGGPSMGMLPKFFTKRTDYTENELGVLWPARKGEDQASSLGSDEFQPINYWMGAYEKPAEVFRYLEKYLGAKRFDTAMQSFYEAWEFKHPGPIDFQNHFSKSTNEDLSWFFDGFIYSTDQMDYALTGIEQEEGKYTIDVKNLGDINGPFPIVAFKDSVAADVKWFPGFEGSSTIEYPGTGYTKFVIDAEHWGIDINRKNNDINLGKKEFPIAIDPFLSLEKDNKPSIAASPIIGWNNYDKTMVGGLVFNKSIPQKKFEFALAPLYSFTTKKLRGVGQVNYNINSKKKSFIANTKIGFNVKSFGLNYNWGLDYYLDYKRFTPSIDFTLAKKKPNSSISQNVKLRAVVLVEQNANFVRDSIISGSDTTFVNRFSDVSNGSTTVYNLQYKLVNSRGVNPWSLLFDLRQANYEAFTGSESYLRASVTWKGAYTYDKGRSVRARIFAGGFLKNTRSDSNNKYYNVQPSIRGTFNLTGQGANDELFDETLFGRSDLGGLWSQQIYEKEGGFKNHIDPRKPNGFTNKYLLAANLTGDLPQDLPLGIPLRPYLDLAYLNSEFAYSFGLSLTFFNERLGVYLPIAISDNIKSGLPDNFKYKTRITWTMDLNRINPLRLIDELSL